MNDGSVLWRCPPVIPGPDMLGYSACLPTAGREITTGPPSRGMPARSQPIRPRRDLLQPPGWFASSDSQIAVLLQAQEVPVRDREVARQPQCPVRRDRAPAVHDLIDAAAFQRRGEAVPQLQRFHQLGGQERAKPDRVAPASGVDTLVPLPVVRPTTARNPHPVHRGRCLPHQPNPRDQPFWSRVTPFEASRARNSDAGSGWAIRNPW